MSGGYPLDAVSALALIVLTAYVLLGGADFGGGVWDLVARGPRAPAQRAAIAAAMGPVWEANHVWLIFLVVLLFTGFPGAFWALTVALFLPLHLVLFGVILRGASFVFRAHGRAAGLLHSAWAGTFGAASTISVLLLGTVLAALSSGGIRVQAGRVIAPPSATWLSPFAIATGLLALSLSAYLAGVYLTLETEGALKRDFRRRAIGAGGAVTLFALLDLALMAAYAPRLWLHFLRPAAWPLLLAAVLLAALSLWALASRRDSPARMLSAAAAALLLWGWAFAQWPYLIYPDFTLLQSAAPPPALRQILRIVPLGLVLLVPSLWLLLRVFKGRNPAASPPVRRDPRPTR